MAVHRDSSGDRLRLDDAYASGVLKVDGALVVGTVSRDEPGA